MSASLVTFLSDFGTADVFVGVCHAVVLRAAPDARIVDLTHAVEPQNVAAGALALASAVRYTGPAVHLAVVDPGVGSRRRALCLETADGSLLVGPDNGLLWPAAEALGGATGAWDISEHAFRLEPVSATFHGRDLFAPAVARLSCGTRPSALGPPIDLDTVVRYHLPRARVEHGVVHATVLSVDRFGNLELDAELGDLVAVGAAAGSVVELRTGRAEGRVLVARTYADVPAGSLLVHEDSTGRLAISLNAGSAAERLAITAGDAVTLAAADE